MMMMMMLGTTVCLHTCLKPFQAAEAWFTWGFRWRPSSSLRLSLEFRKLFFLRSCEDFSSCPSPRVPYGLLFPLH